MDPSRQGDKGRTVIAVLDYDTAQSKELRAAMAELGADARVISTPVELDRAAAVVLPTAKSLPAAAVSLRDRGWITPLTRAVESGRPVLAIGAGLHLLMDVCYDEGVCTGLGVIPGKAVRFDFGSHPAARHFPTPHTGWNRVNWVAECPLLTGLKTGEYFYFDHGAHVEPLDEHTAIGETNHGVDFCSILWQDSLYGVEFLPERSNDAGRRILSSFASLV